MLLVLALFNCSGSTGVPKAANQAFEFVTAVEGDVRNVRWTERFRSAVPMAV